jgi:hypothetical protein
MLKKCCSLSNTAIVFKREDPAFSSFVGSITHVLILSFLFSSTQHDLIGKINILHSRHLHKKNFSIRSQNSSRAYRGVSACALVELTSEP